MKFAIENEKYNFHYVIIYSFQKEILFFLLNILEAALFQVERPYLMFLLFLVIVFFTVFQNYGADNFLQYILYYILPYLIQALQYKMKICFSLLLLLASLFIVTFSCAQNQNCTLPAPENLNADNVFPFIDRKLRDQYWYYLNNANELYRANVNEITKFMFLSVYRNLVGTFLVITTWVKGQTNVFVNTFVRLGDGYQAGTGSNYNPVKLNPFDLSFVLGNGQFIVTTNQLGQLQINNQTITDVAAGQKTSQQIADQKCGQMNNFLQQKYWYYLRNAKVIHTSNQITNKNYYCLFNYVNIVGTFLVISTYDKQSLQKNVITFVRLGDGYQTDSEALYKPVDFTPISLSLIGNS